MRLRSRAVIRAVSTISPLVSAGQRLAQRQVDGDGHDGERRRPQHHHRLRRGAAIGGKLGEKLGMAGMTESGAVQHALGDRIGDDGAGLAVLHVVDRLANGDASAAVALLSSGCPGRAEAFHPSPPRAGLGKGRDGFLRHGVSASSTCNPRFSPARRRTRGRRAGRTAAGQVRFAAARPQARCRAAIPAGSPEVSARALTTAVLVAASPAGRSGGHQGLGHQRHSGSSRLCAGRSGRTSASPRISRRTSFPGFPASSGCRPWSVCARTTPPSRRLAW